MEQNLAFSHLKRYLVHDAPSFAPELVSLAASNGGDERCNGLLGELNLTDVCKLIARKSEEADVAAVER